MKTYHHPLNKQDLLDFIDGKGRRSDRDTYSLRIARRLMNAEASIAELEARIEIQAGVIESLKAVGEKRIAELEAKVRNQRRHLRHLNRRIAEHYRVATFTPEDFSQMKLKDDWVAACHRARAERDGLHARLSRCLKFCSGYERKLEELSPTPDDFYDIKEAE